MAVCPRLLPLRCKWFDTWHGVLLISNRCDTAGQNCYGGFNDCFFYGAIIWTILPTEEHISFESHLFGAIFVDLCAMVYRNRDHKPPEKKDSSEEGYEKEELRLTLQVQYICGEYVDDYLLPFKPSRASSYYD
jgi:hypothetical protein